MLTVVTGLSGWTRWAAAALLAGTIASPAMAQEMVLPSAANPGVRNFIDPDLVYADATAVPNAPLVVFMPGTGGRSEEAPTALLSTIARQGYRVVYLTYDDTPAGVELCERRPPVCQGRFRNSRVFGGDGPPVATPEPEAIVQRLADLLRYLRYRHPGAGWEAYLTPDGRPVWSRLILSGLSQGAGMAAYMAKFFAVDRVVLFSSPWDYTGRERAPSPWLFMPSATPPERWWAERHLRENTTALIAQAYEALRIPTDHILLFDGDLRPGAESKSRNPFHGSTVRLPEYADQWRVMYGRPGD